MKINILELYISRIPGLSTRERIVISDKYSSLDELLKAKISDFEYILNRNLSSVCLHLSSVQKEMMSILSSIRNSEVDIINFFSINYPPQLREIYNPPFLLYKKGGNLNYNFPSVAVVGTRNPSQIAYRASYNLGLEIADHDIYMVSGLALGVDRAAHAGVVKRKGNTVAVLGNGIDFIYPQRNKVLGQEIIDLGGVLLSEYPLGTPPFKYNFPARNRIISGLSQTVVVVEAPLKSGALITAGFALDQGRDVFIHRSSINSIKGAGCRRLLFEGAGIIESLGDLVSFKEAV
ncbi:MAG: DNA-processing protein DprA [Spirochaetia bacterium]|jgi:DNA processing protein|nr:DNA-processing protein DprA [Spirochaetia bacterium]